MIIERVLIFLIFITGFIGLISMKNIIKKIIGLNLLNSSIVLLFILEASRIGDEAPILNGKVQNIVDPIPQALMLTAIVIGVCVTALSLAMAVRLYKTTGSLDITIIKERLKDDC
jgi:multicomponent Na+:H+ antiporter subunit C